ncbi:hypothetical protein GCM10009639_61120 [Kitasatospora putterlickiae]|uniref:DUF4240 domain-containing protein n=1 Tax=Kitasatospora putterlickiae TaxID=221725 RepID=A0ABN1YFM6_9ACTN
MGPNGVPDWFWDALDATRPRLSALESWLERRPRDVLEAFALAHEEAAEALADYAEGVRVNGDVWSEDDTEDLCGWVVGQGRAFWGSVIAGERSLEEAARLYLDPDPDQVLPWDEEVANPEHRGYQSPGSIAHGVYRTRFAEDLHERLDGG